MWEISEGDTKFLYAMKSVLPKDLGALFILMLFTESTGTNLLEMYSKWACIQEISITR